jgi:hypothetical protein
VIVREAVHCENILVNGHVVYRLIWSGEGWRFTQLISEDQYYGREWLIIPIGPHQGEQAKNDWSVPEHQIHGIWTGDVCELENAR